MKLDVFAAIDIGSSSIRMTICEIAQNDFNILEELRQPVKLGKDCFYNGKISRPTIDESTSILKKFKRLCDEYGVKNINAVATSSIKDAANFDIFIDNIRTATNINIEVLSPSKESEYIYHAFENVVKEYDENDNKDQWCIIEVGAGNVEIIILEGQFIIYSRSLPLGTLRTKQMFIKEFHSEENFQNFLLVIIEHELQNLKRQIPSVKIKKVYCIGFEIEELPRIFNRKKSSGIPKISKDSLKKLCNRIKNYTEEEVMHKLNISYNIADSLFTASSILLKLSDFFNCNEIFIPKISLRNGMINSLINIEDEEKYFNKLEKQLETNAMNLGRSMNFDEKHAVKVKELALKIFDLTKDIHNLTRREKTFLLVASILHDIGATLSFRSHHKHSLYIIKEQDFFSFNKREIKIIANIARYHRRSPPKNSHPDYISLPHKDRMIVMKLASILRIADSLDNTHLQLIEDIDVIKEQSKLIIKALVNNQFFSEVYSFRQKKGLFEDFFGIGVELKIEEK